MLLSLTLKNYLPLKYKGVNNITLKTDVIFNIILGRNGYGKTSILRELSPFPPDNNDYDENGCKEIEYRFKQTHYRLLSYTGKKSEHYFYINGKNINTGMTLTVQRELVKQYFNITNDIKNIISGIDKGDVFTSLSPQRRKQVLMDINPNDTSYPSMVYEKIRTNYNQTKGALKHLSQRLVVELKRQEDVKLTSLNDLKNEIKFLDAQIKDALIIHGSLQHVTDPDILDLKNKMDKVLLVLLTDNVKTHLSSTYYWEMIERTNTLIEEDKHKKTKLETLIWDITNKINNINPLPDLTIKGYEEKLLSLDIQIKEINENKNKLHSIISNESFFNNDYWINDDFMFDINGFIENIIHIEPTPDDKITSQIFTQLIENQKELETEINVLEKDIDNAKHQLTHYQQTEDINCPKCNAKFKLGFDKFDPVKLAEFIDKAIETKTYKTTLLKAINDRIELNESWYFSMRSFMQFVKHAKDSRYLIDIIKHYDIGKINHPKLVNILKMMKQFYKYSSALEDKIIERRSIEGYYNLINEKDIRNLYIELENLNIELTKVCRKIKQRLMDLNAFTDKVEQIKAVDMAKQRYSELFDQLEDLLIQKGQWYVKQAIENRINDLTPRKEALVTKLIRSESLNSVVDSVRSQVEELEKREKHLLFLMNKLSPTKGFIGSLMIDFLKSLCGNVNAVIEKVWSDPLRLQSPDIDEDNSDLDYKFKVITTDDKKPISDIKKCSGGESSIIDFALRYTLLRYLGEKSGLVLIMDEVGATFDELHQHVFSHWLAQEFKLDKLPQTFMVSHYVNQYGVFKTDDVNTIRLNCEGLSVRNDDNIKVTIN